MEWRKGAGEVLRNMISWQQVQASDGRESAQHRHACKHVVARAGAGLIGVQEGRRWKSKTIARFCSGSKQSCTPKTTTR